jgi:hypothetical protein
VLFDADAPGTQDLTGVDFTSTVDDSGTGDAADATTEGNGDGDAGDANTWTVTTTDSAGGGGGACPAPGAGGWYPGGWLYRKPLSIGAGNIGSDLTDFPVLVSLTSDTDLAADAQVDFDDILFTAANGTTKLSHEIEQYNEASGELVAWVKVPTVSSSADTIIYMYYGNASVGSQQDPTNVWDTNFKGVWHLQQDPSGTAPQMLDSTLNNNDGSSNGTMTTGDQVAGKAGGSLDFDGSDDYIQATDYDILGAITISAWINWDAVRDHDGIAAKRTSDENNGNWALRLTDTSLLEWMVWSGVDSSAKFYSVSTIPTGAWKHVVLTFDDSTNTAKVYIDGSVDNTTTSFGNNLADTPELIRIGSDGQGTPLYNGRIDGVRISNSIRSADWISAEYINQSDHDNFQSLCAEETDTAAVTSAVAEISPTDVTTSSTGNSFSYDIQATISGAATGVDTVAITVPGSFGAPTVTDVLDDGVSVPYTNNTTGNAISVDITTKITASSKITVLFDSDAPGTQDLTGVDFTSTVDDSGTGDAAQATTEGNGDGNAGDANSWTVTTTDAAAFSCPIGSDIFNDGFEAGNLTAWDGSSAETGDSVTAATDQPKTGTYSLKGQVDTVTDAQAMVWKNIAGQTEIHVKVEMFIPTAFSISDHMTFLQLLNNWSNVLALTIDEDLDFYMWNAVAAEAYGFGTTPTVTKNAWHTWEMRATISDTVGEARVWLDGNLEITATNINLGLNAVDRVSTGYYWSTPRTEANTVYVDDAVLCATPTNPAVTSAVAEISPTDVATSSTGNTFAYDIQATIGGGDTGVDRVAITVPGAFGAPTVTAVQVDGVGVAYTDNTSGNAISVDLTTKVTASSKITVIFDANAPTTQDLTGIDFTSTVDDSGTGDGAQATTEGDGDGDAGDANSWTVTTTDAASGSCPAPSLIFSDGFESGDLTAWDGSTTGSAGDSIGASIIQANGGTYSARAETDAIAAHRAYVYKDFTGETTVSAKIQIYLEPGFSPTSFTEVMYFYDAGISQMLNTEINSSLGLSMWNAVASETYSSGATISTGVWHTLEAAAVIAGANSEARLWLDGTLIIEQTNS